jgi:hypothetical protein
MPMIIQLPQTLTRAYESCWERQSDYHPTIKRDAYRRCIQFEVDNSLYSLARRTGLRSRMASNRARNCYHTEVSCAAAKFVASRIPSLEDLPRDARFRGDLLLENQPTFFEQEELVFAGKLGLYVVHGWLEGDRSYPDFIRIVYTVPDKSSAVVSLDVFTLAGINSQSIVHTVPDEVINENILLHLKEVANTGLADGQAS